MRVLVTGCSGLLGRALCQRLIEEGYSVRGVSLKRDPNIAGLAYFPLDLTLKRDFDFAVEGMDLIIHCAAVIGGAFSMQNSPTAQFTSNVVMNTFLFQSAYDEKIDNLITFGSSTMYPDSDHPVSEEENLLGWPYKKYWEVGWMKRFAHITAKIYSEKLGMKICTLCPTNIYGPGDKFNLKRCHVLPAMIRKVVDRHNPIQIFGDGTELRDLIYVDDMVEAVMLAIKNKATGFYNIGLGKVYSVLDMLKYALDIDGYDNAEFQYIPTDAKMIPYRAVYIKKAKEQLGWEPKIDLREGIERTIEWYKKYHHLPEWMYY